MAKGLMGFDLDDSNAMMVTSFIETFGKDLGKSKHMFAVLEYVFSRLDERWQDHITNEARNVKRFHHVYEWGMTGIYASRLFDVMLTGSGVKRNVTFRWKASKTTVPIPDIPPNENTGAQFKQIHVFVWKAPIMEYNMPVTISPVLGKMLAFPRKNPGPDEGPIEFTKGPVTMHQPGGELTSGAFTGEFITYWGGGGATKDFDSYLAEAIAKDIGQKEVYKYFKQGLKGPAGPMTNARRTAATKSGAALAKKMLEDRDNTYIEQAKNRQAFVNRFASSTKEWSG